MNAGVALRAARRASRSPPTSAPPSSLGQLARRRAARVAEDDPAGDPPEARVARRPSRARRRRRALGEQRLGLLGGDRGEALGEPVRRPAGVEHRLGEARAGCATARRARSSARRAGSATSRRASASGRRRTGRASPRAPGGRRPGSSSSSARSRTTRTQTGPAAVAAAHPARAARPPGRRRSARVADARPPRGGGGRSPGRAFGTTTSALKRAFSSSEALGSPLAALEPAQASLRQGANAFSHALERRRQLRVVAQQHVDHRVALDPVEALGRVDVGRVVVGEEAVAIFSRRDAIRMKIRKAVSLKPNPGGSGSASSPTWRSTRVDVAVVDVADLLRPLGVVGEVLELLDPRLAQRLAEVVVAAARRARGRAGCRSSRGRRGRR